MEGNVRLFLLLYLMPFWSESSSSFLRGLRTRPSHLSIRMTSYYDRDLWDWWIQGSVQFLVLPYVDSWSWNLVIVMLSGYATILQDVSNLFEHLQSLCCPSHPRFLDSLMHLQSFLHVPDVHLGQINHTNRWIEVLCCFDIYVGSIIMTLGVLGSHLVI